MDSQHPCDDFTLAVDIGGTKAPFAFINAKGHLLTPVEKHAVPSDPQGAADPNGLPSIMQPPEVAACIQQEVRKQ